MNNWIGIRFNVLHLEKLIGIDKDIEEPLMKMLITMNIER